MDNDTINLNQAAGQRIRTMRKIMGLTQSTLASKIDVTYQQLQKYETGKNNISINTLERISQALGTSPAKFLEDLSDEQMNNTQLKNKQPNDAFQILHRILALEDPTLRKSILRLLTSLEEQSIESSK